MPGHFDDVPGLLDKLAAYLMSGKIKSCTPILEGLESSHHGFKLFFTGGNHG
tara:strand:- start:657 stop:812 length:156 start_codon:yes stop_codon:yes gene_type:complete